MTELDQYGEARSRIHKGAAAWFAGIKNGTCFFEADARQLSDADSIVGTMCHEVAHAFRAHYELMEAERELEERLTDLTTVYLGFGILTVNNSYRYRASGGLVGSIAVTQWSHSKTGYLSPQAMCFLLALQTVGRRLDDRQRRHIAGLLEANQAAFYKAACKELRPSPATPDLLAARLRLPAPATWPAPPRLETLVQPLPEQPDSEGEPFPLEERVEEGKKARWNIGRPVFRVERTHATRVGALGMMLGGVLGSIACWLVPLDMWLGIVVGPVAGMVVGGSIGKRRRRDFCSDIRCEESLSGNEKTCPRCGGNIMGIIANQNDRLAAEEALEGQGNDQTADQGARR